MTYLTEEGLKKLNDELDHLIAVERPNISKQIAEAREKGDLSENAEYDAAKEAQGLLELKISKLQETIKNSRVLDKSQIQSDTVQILSKVTIQNVKNKAKMTYTLVAETEANLKEGKISIETPIAKGLLGKKVGETAK
ncbi:MAG: transcription elongation factor GreA, partial [Bacteroidales bacterium]|nr:transcription elongation factor GreA [Bacteroidales bacterium]